ncbi:hypothetical protein MC378_03655 [Polaribacter sp. MSW13]|uniref:Uncharacterized protein n=1 Tax=Polaribacter marinus TaxID=2916838 RepID=A0A9X1VPG7_9FLAO|nr:hypothetical protein [Polaribacter marinus]MCI2228250.1 hypothetical protein [Polaribacter marinus]
MSKRNKPEDAWLLDAQVQYRIIENKSRWEVSLVFIDSKDPKHLLIQKIGDYHSKRLAEIYARNIQNTAAKDSRGKQKINKDDYHINNN